jgi:hypothetical protein
MKITLIILNLLAAALVFPAMPLLHRTYIVNGMSMYVELDRAQVINHDQLEKMFPDAAQNDRQDIPRLLMGRRKHEWIVGYPCVFGFLMNALLIGLFMQTRGKAEPERGA